MQLIKKILRIVMFVLAGFWGLTAIWVYETYNMNFVYLIILNIVILVLAALILPIQPKEKIAQHSSDATPHATVPTGNEQPTQSPQMPPVTEPKIHVMTKEEAASFSNESGMYDYEYNDVGIYRPEGANLAEVSVGASITFEEDPANPYDAKAIKALYNGETIGWLYRKGKREMIRDWITNGWTYVAEITEVYDDQLKFWIGMDRD